MENQKADLSGLRIRRSHDQELSDEGGRPKRRLYIVVGIIIILVPLAYLLLSSALFNQAITVQLATATLSSPSLADAVLTASGYVVAQRKAAVASKATGRLEQLNVVEGDRVK